MKYSLSKQIFLVVLILLGLIYAIPNLYHDDPSLQISVKDSAFTMPADLDQKITKILNDNKIPFFGLENNKTSILVRFKDTDTELKAKDIVGDALGEKYIAALNLASRTPKWLQKLGANPLKMGLDLRGGVDFLMEVDTDALLKTSFENDIHSITETLRGAEARYGRIIRDSKTSSFQISFRTKEDASKARDILQDKFRNYTLSLENNESAYFVSVKLPDSTLADVNNYAIDQAMNILRNRVNALGVSEALVQRQGRNHVRVELPGIQDTARAKEIIGKVANLRFQFVDTEHSVQDALNGNVPIGSKLYRDENGYPILLKEKVILRGDSITYANSSIGQDGRPSVNIRLNNGSIVSDFNKVTGENIGQPLAVVYVETKTDQKMVNGQRITSRHINESIISVATIRSALGNEFQITGLNSPKYAQNLALLLRSGSLVAPINIVQERTIGPSLGANNIKEGTLSVLFGFIAIVVFMALYYHLFGVIADMALLLNLIFIIALFSLVGVTMSLPGIAALVLTVAMAVDANVLINERIKEELRLGLTPISSINIGYEKAFVTILDSNVTTVIVALVLFAFGTGPIKGFAVTLIVGIITSMFTAIVFTRVIVDHLYKRNNQKLSIGI